MKLSSRLCDKICQSLSAGCEFSRYYRRLMCISVLYRCCEPIYTSFAAQQRSKLANLLNAPANIISRLLLYSRIKKQYEGIYKNMKTERSVLFFPGRVKHSGRHFSAVKPRSDSSVGKTTRFYAV